MKALGALPMFLAAALAASAEDPGQPLRLKLGQKRLLDGAGVARVSVPDPRVADVKQTEAGELVLSAEGSGGTEITLHRKDGTAQTLRVEVARNDPEELAQEMRKLLEGMEGVRVRVANGKVVLDGKLLTQKDLDRVKLIALAYPEIVNLAALDLSGHQALLSKTLKEKIGFPQVEVQATGDALVLKGTVFREEDKKAAEQIAAAYAPRVVNLLSVREAQVEIGVTFVQYTRSSGDRAGHNVLSTLLGAGSASAGSEGPAYSVSGSAQARLNPLVSKGEATLLKETALTTTSGKEAALHEGGEFGYRVSGVGAADIKFKKYGLMLTATPEVYSSGDVRLVLSLEVSAPAGETPSGDPSFTTFRTQSEVTVKPGETLLVSGLADGLRNKFQEHTPLLGRIPLLKELFSERSDREAHKELAMLVTPRVPALRPAPEGAAKRTEGTLPKAQEILK